MPQIIPIRELKNAVKIAKLCKESAEPVFVTRNGYGVLAVMSMEAYDELTFEIEAASKLAKSCASDTPAVNAKEFFDSFKETHAIPR